MTTDIPLWFEFCYDTELIEKSDYEQHSPLNFVKNINCALLLIHSELDFRCPIVNAEQLFWAAKRYSKVVELVRYPREGHELSRSGEPRHVIDRIQRLIEWCNKYIE